MAEITDWIIIDGVFQKASRPAVSVTSRGLFYGDGCFETFRSYKGSFSKLQAHLKRLEKGLEYLGISYPPGLKEKKLLSNLTNLLERNKLSDEDAVVRIQVWRKGGRGYQIEIPSGAHYSIVPASLTKSSDSCMLATVDIKRIPSSALPSQFKLSNCINYILAAKQAKRKSADDALMETTDGWISETTIANIFWKQNETVFTPSDECDILPGTTRNIVLHLLKEKFQIEVREGHYKLRDIKNAETVWICNSVKEIMPVHQINQVKFKIDTSFLKRLKHSFETYRNEELSKDE